MSTADDDDALSWGGDDDPTLSVGARPAADEPNDAAVASVPPVLPDGFTAVGRGADAVSNASSAPAGNSADAPVTDEPQPLSSSLLVALGVIAGAYLLFTIGWIVGGLRLEGTALFLVSAVGYRFAFWLAVAAPALWFVAVLVLTRTTRSWVRVVCLVAGLLLLVPWPFVMVGAVGL